MYAYFKRNDVILLSNVNSTFQDVPSSSQFYVVQTEFKVISWDISHLLQNIKGQKFAYQLKMSEYVSFFVFIKTKLFPKVSVTLKDFCIFL